MKVFLLSLLLANNLTYAKEENHISTCDAGMRIIATKEISTNQEIIDSVELQIKLLKLEPNEIKFKLREAEESKKIISENQAFLQDSSKAPERFKCTESESEPIIHQNLASRISSFFEDKEMICTLTNKYELQIIGNFTKSGKDLTLASYSESERHVFQGSGMTVEKSFNFNPDKFVNGVKTNMPGYSLDETKNIVTKAVSEMVPNTVSKILISSPSTGKQGSWKDGTPSLYKLTPAPKDSKNPTGDIDKSGKNENTAAMTINTVPVTSLYFMGYSDDSSLAVPLLKITNTVNFVCLNPKNLIKESVNNSARSNLKESSSDDPQLKSKTNTMSK